MTLESKDQQPTKLEEFISALDIISELARQGEWRLVLEALRAATGLAGYIIWRGSDE